MYLNAVIDSFADDIDYAQLVKVFGADPEGARTYSPAQCLGIKKEAILGSPDPSTSALRSLSVRTLTFGCRTGASLA